MEKVLISLEVISDHLLSSLDSRDVALWIRDLPDDPTTRNGLIEFLGLPWRMVFSEWYEPTVIATLESAATSTPSMTRKRGFVQIVDGDPSRFELPQRCLPFYLVNGRHHGEAPTDFDGRLRRLTMLEVLRRSNVPQVLVVSVGCDPIPPELTELWASGFRSQLTFCSDASGSAIVIRAWLDKTESVAAATLLSLPPSRVVEDLVARYSAVYPEDRRIIRVRDRRGDVRQVDVTEADEPERPILESYSLIEERHLKRLMPEDLSEQDFVEFFRDPESSWRPYAAGLPWFRDPQIHSALAKHLRRLDSVGAEEDCIAYIASESGAGGTTLARALAWEVATQGYPVLVAKNAPFIPDALPITNYLKRVHDEIARHRPSRSDGSARPGGTAKQDPTDSPRYETPWVLVFDGVHWQNRDSELMRFRNEMEKAGRPVCILLVTDAVLGLAFYNGAVFKQLAELNHAIDQDQALRLGRHLNRFLQVYGRQRTDSQWRGFHEEHTVRFLEGLAAFWVTLSFWIQGQYDLGESIQEWMYRSFKAGTNDPAIQIALLKIAAMSSERLPLPTALLPQPSGEWPISQLLEDIRSRLGALGLVRISLNGEKHWALVHDILGRFLINALYYDFSLRDALGFAHAKDAEHLRFLLLRQVSHSPVLGEKAYRSFGEEFATTIFKIDPDKGRSSFAVLWREVLESLDTMPRSLRDTSRVFRHHTAVSRRRIAQLDEHLYGVRDGDRLRLLEQAVDDINYALTLIQYTAGSEPNLNLYNSLARAYLDLAEVESSAGASRERISELSRLASDATRRAYEDSPTNSFVIETYVTNLLHNADASPDQAVERCVEALGILFSALYSDESGQRGSHLGALADRALAILFQHAPAEGEHEPKNIVELLIQAWTALADGHRDRSSGAVLADVPDANRARALDVLANPLGRGNMQVIRMRFDLTCVSQPNAFGPQLELVEQLQSTDYRLTPQLRLEYAILLFQNNRAAEGERVFRSLRQLWRESEQFVHVPERLRWLRAADGRTLQDVNAVVGSDYGNRAMARVRQFGNALVPFRPEELGMREPKPGTPFACHVSFGHNGPFLRPVTALPGRVGG